MINSLWLALINLAINTLSIFGKIFEYFKQKKIIDDSAEKARLEERNKILNKEKEIQQKQTEILVNDRKKEEVEKKLENGTF